MRPLQTSVDYNMLIFVLSSLPMKNEIYLGLGSNMGDRLENLQNAVQALAEKLENIRFSPIYESAAWGYEDQPDFLNAALCGTTELPPQELLKFAKEIEDRMGREPTFRNGPRVIDIDILLYGDQAFKEGRLEVPHPSLPLRTFVLQPLVDLSPELVPPGFSRSLKKLLAEFDQTKLHPQYEKQFEIS